METYAHASESGRMRLAQVMLELSGEETMVGSTKVLPAEIDTALRARFRRPLRPRTVPVFGRGAAHVYGRAELRPPQEIPEGVPEDFAVRLLPTMDRLWETLALAMPDTPDDTWDGRSIRQTAEEWAAGENDLAAALAKHARSNPRLRDQIVTAHEMKDWLQPLTEACVLAGLNPMAVATTLGWEGLERLMLDLPVRGTVLRMRQVYHQNPGRRRTPNDLHDIEAMAAAVVHCDAVVADKHVREVLVRVGAGNRFGTVIMSKLSELVSYLAQAGQP
jgi:hypothetical protein